MRTGSDAQRGGGALQLGSQPPIRASASTTGGLRACPHSAALSEGPPPSPRPLCGLHQAGARCLSAAREGADRGLPCSASSGMLGKAFHEREREGSEGERGKERRGEERLTIIHSFSLAKIQKNVSEAILGHRSVLAIN